MYFNITVASLRNLWRFERFGDILHVQLCSHRLLLNIWENLITFHQTLSFLFQKCLVRAEFTALVVEDPEYSFYLRLSIILFLDYDRGGKIPNIWVCPPRNSSEMAKLSTSEQENLNFLGLDSKSICCRENWSNFLWCFVGIQQIYIFYSVYSLFYVVYKTCIYQNCHYSLYCT